MTLVRYSRTSRGVFVIGSLEYYLSQTVETDAGCSEWQGYRTSGGYGKVTIAGKSYGVHRLVLELSGELSDERPWGLHKCDNPPCLRVHPDHLYAGTPQQNALDCVASGKRHGDANSNSRRRRYARRVS